MTGRTETYRRRPGIAWREEKEAKQEALEALADGGDAEMQGTLIVVVSGQIHELNLLGAEIWKLCDGTRPVAQIVDELLGQYEVTREELETDVQGFLDGLEERGWVEAV